MSTETMPVVPYWHLWTDADGISHQSRCALTDFEKSSIQPGAAPQWMGARRHEGMTVLVTVLPVGWVGEWHENPKPQWIIPLAGRWSVESMDGQIVEMGPGEISFGEDMGTRESNGKRGHRSTTVGAEPAVLMLVQQDSQATIASACRFR